MEFQSPYCQLTPGCTNYREGKLLGCASCNARERKEERQKFTDSLKKPRAISQRSEKKAEADAEFKFLRIDFLIEYPVCQATFDGICNHKSEEIHHTSISSLNYLNTETWMAICRHHHNIIERVLSAEKRRELGLLTD